MIGTLAIIVGGSWFVTRVQMMRGKPRVVTTVVDVAAVPCHIVVRATLWTAYVVVASWLLIFIYTAVLLARALDYMEGRHERIGCLPGNPDRDGN